MVVLIDTNVILDYFLIREPFSQSAQEIMDACTEERIKGYVAFHSIPNIYYILRKSYSVKERRNMLKEVCCILKVAGLSHERVLNAIEREDFKDFEDCLQDECAVEINADYIITRNTTDYDSSIAQAVEPEEILKILKEQD